jgi:hypothetical protein
MGSMRFGPYRIWYASDYVALHKNMETPVAIDWS